MPKAFPETITAESFFEDLAKMDMTVPGKLKAFLAALSPLGVTPDFRRTLILRYDTPDGKSVNLGYIDRRGQIWTDGIGNALPPSLRDQYIRDVAAALGVEVQTDMTGKAKTIRAGDHAPKLTEVGNKLQFWTQAIARLLDQLKHTNT
jgi:hypothetical protein